METYYIDFEGGNDANATPIVITAATAHGLVLGDYVSIINHTGNTNANGFWDAVATVTQA